MPSVFWNCMQVGQHCNLTADAISHGAAQQQRQLTGQGGVERGEEGGPHIPVKRKAGAWHACNVAYELDACALCGRVEQMEIRGATLGAFRTCGGSLMAQGSKLFASSAVLALQQRLRMGPRVRCCMRDPRQCHHPTHGRRGSGSWAGAASARPNRPRRARCQTLQAGGQGVGARTVMGMSCM